MQIRWYKDEIEYGRGCGNPGDPLQVISGGLICLKNDAKDFLLSFS